MSSGPLTSVSGFSHTTQAAAKLMTQGPECREYASTVVAEARGFSLAQANVRGKICEPALPGQPPPPLGSEGGVEAGWWVRGRRIRQSHAYHSAVLREQSGYPPR